MQLDTTYTVNTPEGIALQLSAAGPIPRLLAWLLDLLIRLAIIITLFISLASLGRMGIGIAFILIFLLEWFYPVYFELRHQGQTPGKRALGIYVVNVDASPITPAASIIRNLLRAVDFLPLIYGFGLTSMLLNKRFQRLGDLAANSVVLHKMTPPQALADASDLAPHRPAIQLSLPEQQAILLFSQRSQQISNARQTELAKLTGPLIADSDQPAQYLHGIARWLSGRRT